MHFNTFGHEWQKSVLSKFLDNLSHAYLFSGPSGIGKLSMAKDFARLILSKGSSVSDLERQIAMNQYPDCIVLNKLWIDGINTDLEQLSKSSNFDQSHRAKATPSVKTDTILISDVHNIIKIANRSPLGEKKVIIIRDIERMNMNSANAFLKTLEEPPEDTIFICTSSNPDLLMPTIVSRVQELEFGLLASNEIREFLAEKFPNNLGVDLIEKILKFSFGKPKVAYSYASNPGELALIEEYFEKIGSIYRGSSLLDKIKHVDSIYSNNEEVSLDMNLWSYFLRTQLYQSPNEKIVQDLDNLFNLKMDMKTNTNKRLALENFYFSLHE